MYILPVNQPYADLIIKGYKHFETRPMNVNIRGKIAIHANKVRVTNYIVPSSVKEAMIKREVTLCDLGKWDECCDTNNYGVIIGVCDIINVYPTEELRHVISDFEMCVGDYTKGRYAYQIENPAIFNKPIPYKAHQGWNTIDDKEFFKMITRGVETYEIQ